MVFAYEDRVGSGTTVEHKGSLHIPNYSKFPFDLVYHNGKYLFTNRFPLDAMVCAAADRVGHGAAVEHAGSLRNGWPWGARAAHTRKRCHCRQDAQVPSGADEAQGREDQADERVAQWYQGG